MWIRKPARAPRSTSSCRGIIPPRAERATQGDAGGEAKGDLTGQGTILLVEDEEGLRSLNARGLRSRGYTVIEASNGIEAMEALEQKNGAVDLVVSDVVMPEMDGPALLRAMRARNPDLKIIFVSGYAEDAFAKSLKETEKFDFLPKPFALSALVAKVKETMAAPSSRRLRRVIAMYRQIPAPPPRPSAAAALPDNGFTFRPRCPC